jgi:hypothetical protein
MGGGEFQKLLSSSTHVMRCRSFFYYNGNVFQFCRFPRDHDIFTRIINILTSGFWNLDDDYYIPMSSEAIDVIYQVTLLSMILFSSVRFNSHTI